MSYLELENVTKIYPNGTKAVNETSLSISEGELMVFVGPSGCGKSTLLRMIAGLEDITNGEISLDGNVINNKDVLYNKHVSVPFKGWKDLAKRGLINLGGW